MKNKKIIILVIVLLLCVGGAIFIYTNKDKIAKLKILNKELENVTLSADTIEVTCAENGNFGEGTVGGEYNQTINPGIRVVCDFFIHNYTDKDLYIKNVELDYDALGDFETIEIQRISFDYKEEDKKHVKLKLNTTIEGKRTDEDGDTTSAIPFFGLKFYIKSIPKSDKVILNLKNIKISNDDYLYKVDDFSQSYDVEKYSKYAYEFNETATEVTFYKDNDGYKEINKYKCNGKCYPYAAQCFGYADLNEGKMFIIDDEKAILFDMNKDVIGEYEMPLYTIYDTIYDTSTSQYIQKYFVGKKTSNGKFAISDFNGNTVKEYDSDGYGTVLFCDINSETYSLKYNLITIKKNNKYGITRITKDELLTDYQFDDIRLYNDKYYKAKVGDKWYLYDLSNNEKVIFEGYKQIFMPADDILFVQDGDYLYVRNYNNENLTEEKIKVYIEYNEKACCGAASGMYIFQDSKNNNIIHIIIDTDSDVGKADYVAYEYEYNISEKKITKKDTSSR